MLLTGLEDWRTAEALRCCLNSTTLCCFGGTTWYGTCNSEAGLSDLCPDMAKAVNTWQFAIKTLKKARVALGCATLNLLAHAISGHVALYHCVNAPEAAGPKLDPGTLQYVTQIEA